MRIRVRKICTYSSSYLYLFKNVGIIHNYTHILSIRVFFINIETNLDNIHKYKFI